MPKDKQKITKAKHKNDTHIIHGYPPRQTQIHPRKYCMFFKITFIPSIYISYI